MPEILRSLRKTHDITLFSHNQCISSADKRQQKEAIWLLFVAVRLAENAIHRSDKFSASVKNQFAHFNV